MQPLVRLLLELAADPAQEEGFLRRPGPLFAAFELSPAERRAMLSRRSAAVRSVLVAAASREGIILCAVGAVVARASPPRRRRGTP